ncbi:fibronectin type III domain-containing protein [Geodermatophilus sp. SYSU D00708]
MTRFLRIRSLVALLAGLLMGTAMAVVPASEARAGTLPDAIDGFSRSAVVKAWKDVAVPALAVPTRWNGSVQRCQPGAPSAAAQQATLTMVNLFRDLADLPRVRFDAALSAQAQQAALIMAANNGLSHQPPRSWACYTAAGAAAAGKSNLALGVTTGAAAVASAYMDDAGVASAGHRRWLLDPNQRTLGSGQTDRTNALYVIGADRAPDPAAPEWIPWPSAGYLPVQAEPEGHWSLSNPSADFSDATVRVVDEAGRALPVTVQPVMADRGPNTLVFDVRTGYRSGGADRSFTVTVAGIHRGAQTVTHTWTTRLFDVTRAGTQVTVPRPRTTVTAVDTSPPKVVSFDFTPKAVNAASGLAEVTVTTRIADASGLSSWAWVTFEREDGSDSIWGMLELVSGTGRDGLWRATVPVPATAQPGRWDVVLALGDLAGHDSEGPPPSAFPRSLTVTATAPPTNVRATARAGGADVSWTAPPAVGRPITGYRVTASPGGRTCTTTGATQCTVTGLTNGSAYTFSVAATDAAGVGPASRPSTAVTPAGPPGAPTNLWAVGANRSATVSWSAPSTNGRPVTGYRVAASPGGRTCSTTGATRCTVTGLTNGTAYTFSVAATNAAGTGAASARSAAVTPATRPGAPRIGTSTSGNGYVVVRWSPPADNGGAAITGYTLRMYRNGVFFGTAPAAAGATRATVTHLTNGDAYSFSVIANNAVGASAASARSATVIPRAG